MHTLNIGILAHVDAGKTSLTERLLFTAGVIPTLGSVDAGNTSTDSLELERQRGITIRSAVVSFTIGELTINLIDTPGHADFIAEVERALAVLDGVVLVVSAVEGVQPQTRVLMRTLRKLGLPTIIFVNKVDRAGALHQDLPAIIADKLASNTIPLSTVGSPGTAAAEIEEFQVGDNQFTTRLAELLADNDEDFLAAYLDSEHAVPAARYWRELRGQARRGLVFPVLFGSAITGAGIQPLIRAIQDYLPTVAPSPSATPAGLVFKIERGPAGERIAYVRQYAGQIRARDRLSLFRRDPAGQLVEQPARVTSVRVFQHGTATTETALTAGNIGKLVVLPDIRLGDRLGSAAGAGEFGFFAPPSLRSVVRPRHASDSAALYEALRRLAEQDPFIAVGTDGPAGELSVRLYGEVQQEVLNATLAAEFGLAVEFADTETVLVERPVGVGEAVEELGAASYFYACVGLRVEPTMPGAGIRYRLGVELGGLPLSFHKAIEETVHTTLVQGLYGWEVTDCLVTLTKTGYFSPLSTAGDFRRQTPLVLMSALKQAGTQIYEPISRFELDLPAACLGTVLAGLAELGGVPGEPEFDAQDAALTGTLPTARVAEFQRRLPGLTQGEGAFVARPDGYQPLRARPPVRPRLDDNPLDRDEYLLRVLKHI